jgi:predicted aldo/keto reductase-like oxidoreductase
MTSGEHGGVGAPLEECRRIVDAYAGAGGNVIDTAVNYRGGASEEVLGHGDLAFWPKSRYEVQAHARQDERREQC